MTDRTGPISKATVTRLFVGGIAAMAAGFALALVAVVAALASGVVTIGGPGVVAVDPGPLASTAIVVAVGVLVIAGGAIAGVASWIGALLITARLDDKTWFVALLVLGLCSFGVVAMIAYVLAGPDGRGEGEARPAPASGAAGRA